MVSPGEDLRNLDLWGADCGATYARVAPMGSLLPLSDLILTWGDIQMTTWRYHQIADFFNKWKSKVRPLNYLTIFESWCINNPEARHLLSKMYKLVLKVQYTSIPYYIREREIGHHFSTTQIQNMIKTTHCTSISSHIQEM